MIHEIIIAELDLIYQGLRDKEYNWIDVKKLLITSLPPKFRTGFSKRHPLTKIPRINNYELEIIETWKRRYNSILHLRGDEEYINE